MTSRRINKHKKITSQNCYHVIHVYKIDSFLNGKSLYQPDFNPLIRDGKKYLIRWFSSNSLNFRVLNAMMYRIIWEKAFEEFRICFNKDCFNSANK